MAAVLTRALVGLHGAGRADTYDAALLDVAQDHLLWLLAELGHFEGGELVFKGGTSLRKCRLGGAGRFSTDLDFVAPSDDVVLTVCEAIDGAAVAGFRYRLESTRGDGRHWALAVEHEDLGRPNVPASVEFARRPLALTPDHLPFVVLPVHRGYEIQLPVLPVVNESEACAEKLARYRRVALGRDVYDLAKLAGRTIDERIVRRLWVVKVWQDVNDDGRGGRPLTPEQVLAPRRPQDFAPESIGKLTQPVDLAGWERRARERFSFLAKLDEDELVGNVRSTAPGRSRGSDRQRRLPLREYVHGGSRRGPVDRHCEDDEEEDHHHDHVDVNLDRLGIPRESTASHPGPSWATAWIVCPAQSHYGRLRFTA